MAVLMFMRHYFRAGAVRHRCSGQSLAKCNNYNNIAWNLSKLLHKFRIFYTRRCIDRNVIFNYTGDMLLKAETVIEKEDTAETIHDRLSRMGKYLLLENFTHIFFKHFRIAA